MNESGIPPEGSPANPRKRIDRDMRLLMEEEGTTNENATASRASERAYQLLVWEADEIARRCLEACPKRNPQEWVHVLRMAAKKLQDGGERRSPRVGR